MRSPRAITNRTAAVPSYEAEPEEEPQEEESTEPQEEGSEEPQDEQDAEAVTEDSSSESEKVEADVSEEDNTDQDTEAADGQSAEKQTGSKKAEDSHDDSDDAPDAADADDPASETLVEGGTAEEIKLITEKTQLTYEYIDEFYEDGIDDEKDDGIDDGYFVYAEFGADAKLPEGVELSVEEITKESDPEAYEAYCEKALSGLQDKYDENTALSFARFYDIKFVYNGKEVEPAGDVKVRIEYKKAVEIEKETNVDAVHFDKSNDEEPEIIESEVNKSETTVEKKDEDDTVRTVEFESSQFSVYGIIGSYTVDFHYEVNGKMYEYTFPGGGFVSFYKLVEVLGIPGVATEENPEPDPVPIADLTTLGIEKPVITLNGGQKEGEEYTGDDTTEEPWVYKWESLPQYDKSGNRITYSVSETGYTIDGETIDITSEGLVPPATPGGIYELITTNRIPTEDISAQKYWPEGQTVPEGTLIKLTITAKLEDETDPNGVTVTPATITLDGKVTEGDAAEVETENTLWQYTWKNLPKYDKDGKKITYTVAETEYKIGEISYEELLANANEPAHEGVDFSFTNELPGTRITVEKTWSDNTGSWPEGVSAIMTLKGSAPIGENGEMKELETLVLPDIKDGEESVPQTAEYALSGTETSHTWYNLPMYTQAGEPITYTVDETGMTYTQAGGEPVPIQNWAQAFAVRKENDEANNKVTIDNTPLETEISLTKVWTVNGQPKTMEDGDSIEFKLYRTDSEGELTLSSDGYEADKGTPTLNKILYVAGGENPGWQTVTISKLPKYVLKLETTDEGTIAYYTGIAYYAVEMNVEGDTRISYTLSPMYAGSGGGEDGEGGGKTGATGPSETTDPTQSAIGTGTITIYNRDTDVDITVLKVDERDSDTKLPNAEFQILKWKDNNERYLAYNLETKTYASPGEESKSKLTTGQEQGPDYGKLVFEGLTDGKYKIVETKAPEGYIRESDVEIFFSIDNGTVTWTDEEGSSINTDTKPNQVDYDAEDLAFTVGNTPGASLPNCGGPGTRLFTILGTILIAGAGLLLWRRRRTI